MFVLGSAASILDQLLGYFSNLNSLPFPHLQEQTLFFDICFIFRKRVSDPESKSIQRN